MADKPKKRQLKPAELCEHCKKPSEECACLGCSMCDSPITPEQSKRGCGTSGCGNPFYLHTVCLKKKLKSKRRVHIKCSCCEKTTDFSDQRPVPIWEAASCCDPLQALKVTAVIFMLSWLPYFILFSIGDPASLDKYSWYVWVVVSWMIVGCIYVTIKVAIWMVKVFSYPTRAAISFLTRLIPGKRKPAVADGEDDDLYIVATPRGKDGKKQS
jgi:hypothetical protein